MGKSGQNDENGNDMAVKHGTGDVYPSDFLDEISLDPESIRRVMSNSRDEKDDYLDEMDISEDDFEEDSEDGDGSEGEDFDAPSGRRAAGAGASFKIDVIDINGDEASVHKKRPDPEHRAKGEGRKASAEKGASVSGKGAASSKNERASAGRGNGSAKKSADSSVKRDKNSHGGEKKAGRNQKSEIEKSAGRQAGGKNAGHGKEAGRGTDKARNRADGYEKEAGRDKGSGREKEAGRERTVSHSKEAGHSKAAGRVKLPEGAAGSRKPARGKGLKRFGGLELTAMDMVVAVTGIVVLLVAFVTGGFVISANSVKRQVEDFAAVGEELQAINMAGEDVFLAMADAKLAQLSAAGAVEDETESETYEEKDDTSGAAVVLKLNSVQKDLKIKFTNKKTGKLIGHVPFEVEIKGPSKTYNKTDDDEDGIIYLKELEPGNYTVTITGPAELKDYSFSQEPVSVTVKDKIEYKKIDVTDEVKSESEVNAAKEDTAVAPPQESVLQDTVEWVESTKTALGADGNVSDDAGYVEVKKNDIPDPSASASIPFEKFAGVKLNLSTFHLNSFKPVAPLTEEGVDGGKTAPDGNVDGATTSTPESSSSSEESSSSTPESSSDSSSGGSSDSGDAGGSSSGSSETGGDKPADKVKVDSIFINGEKTGSVGKTVSLSVTVSPESASDKSVTWSSSDESVATVSGGTVNCLKAGSVTIKAKANDGSGVEGSITIDVKAAAVSVTGVKINQSNPSVKVGATVGLTAAVTPAEATDKTLVWTSSDGNIATVDGNGVVTGKKAGTAKITVTTKDGGKTDSVNVTVTTNESNSLTLNDQKITAGEIKDLSYSTTGTVSSRSFSSSNTTPARIDGNGRITAIRTGETTITVTIKFANGETITKKAKLTVVPASVKSISLKPTEATLKVGDTLKLEPSIDTSGYHGCLWYSSDQKIVSVVEHGNGTITALKPGKVTITACSSEDTSKKATCVVTVTGADPRNDTKTPLKDKAGNLLYIKDASGKYVAAVVADYYKYDKFYRTNSNVEYKYTGWQTIDGKRYYFDKNGNKVTGDQVIKGARYSFGSDGALNMGSGVMGIDVSKHNGSINWTEVKNSGVSYVIIRCGYRGSSTGALIEDPKFKSNIQGAINAGLKVGVYFFSQAVNEVEAVEEASMTVSLIRNYKLTYPVFLDVEAAGGRADGLDTGTRTNIINAYCQTIKNSGYSAGVYANKNWLSTKINTGALGGNKIWLAQYAAVPTYGGKYDMWQYSSTGRISGISGNVDMNISYMAY